MSEIMIEPRNIDLPGNAQLRVELLPPDADAAEAYIDVQARGTAVGYQGQLCLTPDGEERAVLASDIKSLYDPEDREVVADLVELATVGFEPGSLEGRLLLRGIMPVGLEDVTVATVNVHFGDLVYRNEPPSVANASEEARSVAKLHELDVLPGFLTRNRKIGSVMLAAVADLLADNFDSDKTLRLNVAEGNLAAMGLYSAVGLNWTGNRKMVTLPSGVQVRFQERSGAIGAVQQHLHRRLANLGLAWH